MSLLTIGTRITTDVETYRVESNLVKGGMGSLYKCRTDSGDYAVLKAPKIGGIDIDKDNLVIDKLRVETKILSTLRHDNIVRYLDEKNLPNTCYLFLEYLEGSNFYERYVGKPIDQNMVKQLALKMLETADYLHKRNIIHRDIKPSNIMTDNHRTIVLLDFGTAKQGYVQMPNTGNTIIGTPGWSAPEQFTSGVVTTASDTYAISCVLFFLLTGKEPRIYMASNGKIMESPRNIIPSISSEISDVIMTGADPDVSRRFQTTSDMINAIIGNKTVQLDSPHIILQGSKYPIDQDIEIGRQHTCNDKCVMRGFGNPAIFPIYDDNLYISKHHARISINHDGTFSIEDLNSLNHTAISHDGGRNFLLLPGNIKETLKDGDIIALAYNRLAGGYVTFVFKER